MIALYLALALAGSPAAHTFAVEPARSTLRYHVVHKLHTVDGSSSRIEGKVVVQPDGRVLTMVRAPMASFESGDGNRDAHMQEVMEVGLHPFVTFKGIGNAPALATGGRRDGPVEIGGEVELHGVKTPVRLPVQVASLPGGGVRVRGTFEVSLDAHHVERPSLLFVKIDDACRVDVDLLLREEAP